MRWPVDKETKLVEWFGGLDEKLAKLWDKLCKEKYLFQTGPYPADHGKKAYFKCFGFSPGISDFLW